MIIAENKEQLWHVWIRVKRQPDRAVGAVTQDAKRGVGRSRLCHVQCAIQLCMAHWT